LANTVFKGAYLPTDGGDSGTWGAKLNSSLSNSTFPTFDNALGGISTVSLSGTTPVTLTSAQSGTAILRLIGTISTNINVVTLCQGFTFVENLTSGAFTVTIDNGVGTPVTLPQGGGSIVIFDATNGPRLAIPSGGTMASQNANAVAITGGTISGITDLAIADGGTGSSTAALARTALGLAIGINVQAYAMKLTDIAALAATDSNVIVGNGTTWVAESGATARTSLGLGTIATQASSSVSITGGSITGITDLTVADGGTGSSTAAAAIIALGAMSNVNVQTFTASGTYTPTAQMKSCLVFSTGGGGGSGGADCPDAWVHQSVAIGGDGGGAATCIEYFTAAQIGASQTVTIGAGGTAGANTGTDGGTGGNTTFGSLHTAGGGGKGYGAVAHDNTIVMGNHGDGGTATNGLINLPGQAGFMPCPYGALFSLAQSILHSGRSFWGGVSQLISPTVTNTAVAGVAGPVYGSGAVGASVNQTTTAAVGAAGAVGGGGYVMVIEFI
jgi:hypothetical protein